MSLWNVAGWSRSGGHSRDMRLPFIGRGDPVFWVGLIVVALSLLSAFITFLILTGLTPIVPRNDVVVVALFFNVVFILAMIGIVAWQVAGLLRAWQEKEAGARLHIRIVALFSIVAAAPALLLAIGATVSFSRSLDNWFSGRVRAIIENSVDVALTYVEEHGQIIRTDVVNMARDVDAGLSASEAGKDVLSQLVMTHAGLRELPAAYVIDRAGLPVLSVIENRRLPFSKPTPEAMTEAAEGQIPWSMSTKDYRITAVAKLKSLPGRFLYVSRGVSRSVIDHLKRTELNAAEYTATRRARGGLKWAHALMYLTISLTGVLAAIWSGMWFAKRFVAPIRRVIRAAQEVSKGNLDVALPERRGEGDLRRLSQNFNTMTRELRHNQNALVSANDQLLERRRFIEAVLSGVSAGVIGLDSEEYITLVSRSAQSLLQVKEDDLVGKALDDALPEIAAAFHKAETRTIKSHPQHEVTLTIDGEERTFALKITQEQAGDGDVGSVLTFDDITELAVAQRTSAWADVARRIAHEIKNPLTPIILSVGRLRKNYGDKITEKRELFDNLTSTIERQAGDIKTMVDEFAAFARMPAPQMEIADLRDAVQEPVILFRESHGHVSYGLDLPDEAVVCRFDRRLITQAVTNLVKNATEAVESMERKKKNKNRVDTRIKVLDDRVMIEVSDNGIGLPKSNRAKILEPYVTNKGTKGTGLGLAMVQKIVEQHGGTIELHDAPCEDPKGSPGALMRLTLPLAASTDESEDVDTDSKADSAKRVTESA